MVLYSIEEHIGDAIISYLKKIEDGVTSPEKLPWGDMGYELDYCIQRGVAYITPLHRMILPYYKMFVWGDNRLCTYNLYDVRQFFTKLAKADREFHIWAEQEDLIAATESWGDCLKRMNNDHVSYYFDVLDLLVDTDCCFDWLSLSEELKEMLFRAEVYSDYKTDELFCVLHAYSMIMQQNWTLQKKKENLELLYQYWGFLKYYYSVMIRHIVGCRLSNFTAISNAVTQSNTYHPHLHIYYCAIMERADSFGLDKKKQQKLDNACMRIRDIIDQNEPSEILYELCDALFPEDFQRMLNEHRPKSYSELEDENKRQEKIIRQMSEESAQMNRDYERMVNTLKEAIEASIPVAYIESQLMSFPPHTAWDMFESLNNFFEESEAWRKYDIGIRKKLKNRMIENDQRADRFLDALDKIKDKPSEIIYGDKVAEKTVIPNVGNYKPEIQSQTMNIPLPPIEQQNPKLLDNE